MIDTLCDEAGRLGLAGVCVAPCHVARAALRLGSTAVRVVTVAGFPLGSSRSRTKAYEAAQAAQDGALEVDMVISIGHLLAGEWHIVYDDIAAVRRALADPGLMLKVIIEAPALTSQQIVEASAVAVEAGADYVKTGTGFRGPAVPEHVSLIRRAVGVHARIKAAGGIRTAAAARLLLAAGADRLGSSAAAELLRS
jgi:deoxyribose-phosphate aldolase